MPAKNASNCSCVLHKQTEAGILWQPTLMLQPLQIVHALGLLFAAGGQKTQNVICSYIDHRVANLAQRPTETEARGKNYAQVQLTALRLENSQTYSVHLATVLAPEKWLQDPNVSK